MRFEIASIDSLIIYFGKEISKENSSKVKIAYECLKNSNIKGLIDIVPSYSSIFISYDIFSYDFESLKEVLEQNIDLSQLEKKEEKIINIDVYYGYEVGFDLENVSRKSALSIDEVIHLHSSKVYDIYAVGFLPGFAYLGNVDGKIACSRLQTPRKIIPKGSVALADTQTAIYPQNSPGGWNILGRTTFECFDKSLENLSVFEVGLKVKFNPISKKEFLNQGGII